MGCFEQIFINLSWYHFLYRLEHLFSIIFQLLVSSYFAVSLFFKSFSYWIFGVRHHLLKYLHLLANKEKRYISRSEERDSKKPLNSSKNSFIVAWITDFIPIPLPFNGRFACACNPNCGISFCLSCCQVCFVLSHSQLLLFNSSLNICICLSKSSHR